MFYGHRRAAADPRSNAEHQIIRKRMISHLVGDGRGTAHLLSPGQPASQLQFEIQNDVDNVRLRSRMVAKHIETLPPNSASISTYVPRNSCEQNS
jgi:hypothetical protein